MLRWLRSKAKLFHSKAHAAVTQAQQETDIDTENNLTREMQDVRHLDVGDTAPQIASLDLRAWDHHDRYERLGDIHDLNQAISLIREALSLSPPGHPDRPKCLCCLGVRLFLRYGCLSDIDDLNEAVILGREACSLGHPGRSVSMDLLAQCLSFRYKELKGINDLDEAIVFGREALSLYSPGRPDRSVSLSYLADNLSSRYEQLGGIDDLNEALVLYRETLSLRPPGHPGRSDSLASLTTHLFFRYKQRGRIDDLNEAIVFGREVPSRRSPGHPGHYKSLGNLAIFLSSRYEHLGVIDDLDEAIILGRKALILCPPGHPDRSGSLNNLANSLLSWYKIFGVTDDINEAIVLGQDALSLCPPGHPGRPMTLNNLAHYFSSRYNWLGGIDDIKEAIILSREALFLCPLGHPDHSRSLHSLATSISTRYRGLGEIDDLNEDIALGREALSLHSRRLPDSSMSSNGLTIDLSFQDKRLGIIEGLDDAIFIGREVSSSRLAAGHPDLPMSLNNLAVWLTVRYDLLGRIEDMKEAIAFGREALLFRPLGHHKRSAYLKILAKHLSLWYKRARGSDDLNAAKEDKLEALFCVYAELEHVSQTVSSDDLSAARAWIDAAEEFHHRTTLPAYETALRLLVEHSVALPALPQHLPLLKSLSSSLAVDAFSACLRNQSPFKAVELLEQGRGVFWTQLTRLRSPLDDVITTGPKGRALADEFTRLTPLIHMALHTPGPDQHDRVFGLNLELKKVVSNIRELPGLSRFLLPWSFSDLRYAARDGPVIIMNASKYGCDALVVFLDKDPVHIPLPVTKKDVQELTLQLRTLTRSAKTNAANDTEKEFMIFLRELWDRLVSHIVNALQTTCPRNSRIWWCPTAEFSLLPLHAAAPYRPHQKGLSDFYVSSYTTTLAALIRARRPSVSDTAHEKPCFIAIDQAAPKGGSKLPCVGAELDTIGQLVDGPATFTRIEGEDACISTVEDELGKNELVHFACHGVPNQEQPFESAFALRDGEFTIQHINQCNLKNPKFAYLSACHTTVGDQESPDEMIHLASAIQFAGFRSVIGTMWGVDDSQTNKVISMFYRWMIDEKGCLDYTRAARALRMTMKKVDIPMDQRILYIHLGA